MTDYSLQLDEWRALDMLDDDCPVLDVHGRDCESFALCVTGDDELAYRDALFASIDDAVGTDERASASAHVRASQNILRAARERELRDEDERASAYWNERASRDERVQRYLRAFVVHGRLPTHI